MSETNPSTVLFNLLKTLKPALNQEADEDGGDEGTAKLKRVLNSKAFSSEIEAEHVFQFNLRDALLHVLSKPNVDENIHKKSVELFEALKEANAPAVEAIMRKGGPDPDNQKEVKTLNLQSAFAGITQNGLSVDQQKTAMVNLLQHLHDANEALMFPQEFKNLFTTRLNDIQFDNLNNFEKAMHNLGEVSNTILQGQAQHAVYAQGFERLGLALANLAFALVDYMKAESGHTPIERNSQDSNRAAQNFMPMRA